MRKISGVLFFVTIFSACVMAQTAEPQAAMSAHQRRVEQSKDIEFTVKVSPTPNVPGDISIIVVPESGPERLPAHNGVGSDMATAEMGVTIPVGATLGKWKIAKVFFQPTGQAPIELSVKDEVTFEVIKYEAKLPSSATVEVK